MNGYHTTSINNSITPTHADLLAVAEKAGLKRDSAKTVLDSMCETIANF